MFKKLIKIVHQRGSCTRSTYESSKFCYSDWRKWLKTVNEFYKNSPKNEISPLFVKKPLDNRPYISISLFDQQIVALLDSGAAASVVGSKGIGFLKQFNLQIHPVL